MLFWKYGDNLWDKWLWIAAGTAWLILQPSLDPVYFFLSTILDTLLFCVDRMSITTEVLFFLSNFQQAHSQQGRGILRDSGAVVCTLQGANTSCTQKYLKYLHVQIVNIPLKIGSHEVFSKSMMSTKNQCHQMSLVCIPMLVGVLFL